MQASVCQTALVAPRLDAQLAQFILSQAAAALSFTDYLSGRRVPLSLDDHGSLLSPAEQRAKIRRPLQLLKAEEYCVEQQSLKGYHPRQQQPLLALGSIFSEYCGFVPVRIMFRCNAAACQRLTSAPADAHVTYRTTRRWAECVMKRVTRGRVSRMTQVRLQQRVWRARVRFMYQPLRSLCV